MAVTVTIDRQSWSPGNLFVMGQLDLGTYAANGIAITANALKLGRIDDLQLTPAGGLSPEFDKANLKIKAYRSAGFTPAGTNSKPTFTVESAGAIGASMEVGLSADAATATVEGGTGITAQRVLTTTSPVGIPTFTGTAVAAAALTEVGAVDISATKFRFVAIGPF